MMTLCAYKEEKWKAMRQKYIWVAEYEDGTGLKEFNDDGTENSFYDLDRSKLKRFGLMGGGKGYWLDCKSGVFYVDKKEVCVRFIDSDGNIYEFMRQNGSYNDIIQYKSASTSLTMNGRVKDSIESYSIGWKAALIFEKVTFLCKFILNVSANDNPEYLYIWLVANKNMNGILECQIGDKIQQFKSPLKQTVGGELNWVWK